MSDSENVTQAITPINKSKADEELTRIRFRIEYEGPPSQHVHVEIGEKSKSLEERISDWWNAIWKGFGL